MSILTMKLPQDFPMAVNEIDAFATLVGEAGMLAGVNYGIGVDELFRSLALPAHLVGKNDKPLRAFPAALEPIQKTDGSWVTKGEKGINEWFMHQVKALLPHVAMWGEESEGELQGIVGTGLEGDFDPTDGTRALLMRVPLIGTQAAISYWRKPIVGAMYDCSLHLLAVGVVGAGVFCEGVRLPSIPRPSLQEATFCLEGSAIATLDGKKSLEAVLAQRHGTSCLRNQSVVISFMRVLLGLSSGMAFGGKGLHDLRPLVAMTRACEDLVLLDLEGNEPTEDFQKGLIILPKDGKDQFMDTFCS